MSEQIVIVSYPLGRSSYTDKGVFERKDNSTIAASIAKDVERRLNNGESLEDIKLSFPSMTRSHVGGWDVRVVYAEEGYSGPNVCVKKI